jgi:hypothetical protein
MAGIKIKKSNKGLLHKKLGMSKDKPIPTKLLRSKLASAKAHHDVKLEREIQFAINAHKFKH